MRERARVGRHVHRFYRVGAAGAHTHLDHGRFDLARLLDCLGRHPVLRALRPRGEREREELAAGGWASAPRTTFARARAMEPRRGNSIRQFLQLLRTRPRPEKLFTHTPASQLPSRAPLITCRSARAAARLTAMAENAWEVTLLNLGQEETAVLRLSDAGVSIAQHVIPLRQLRSWDHEAESNVITLRLLSGAEPATVCFRTADATEICTRIGERSLAEVRAARVAAAPSEAESPRGAVLPAQLGGRPAELHVVDAGVKLIVDQELVRFIAFTEIRSWNDNPQSSTLSIVTRDHRTLEIFSNSIKKVIEGELLQMGKSKKLNFEVRYTTRSSMAKPPLYWPRPVKRGLLLPLKMMYWSRSFMSLVKTSVLLFKSKTTFLTMVRRK